MSDFYPKLGDKNQSIPDRIADLGDKVADKVGGVFPISRGYYGGKPLYGERPTHDTDSSFYDEINFENGDAVLCIGAIARAVHDKRSSRNEDRRQWEPTYSRWLSAWQ